MRRLFVVEVEGNVEVELVVLVRVEVDDFVVVNPIDCRYKLTNLFPLQRRSSAPGDSSLAE